MNKTETDGVFPIHLFIFIQMDIIQWGHYFTYIFLYFVFYTCTLLFMVMNVNEVICCMPRIKSSASKPVY